MHVTVSKMFRQLTLVVLIFDIVAFSRLCTDAKLINGLVTGDWDGVGLYISVKREVIQNKLDEWYNSVSDDCGDGPRLFVPQHAVLPDIHNCEKHPVYLDFGFVRSFDFDEYLKDNPNPSVSISGLEVTVTIPLLADAPDGPPVYALALANFYEKSRGDVPKINFIYPYIPVDEITLNNEGVCVKNGSDEIRLSFNRPRHPCKPPTSIVKEEFDEFVTSDFQFGLPEPDYSFCDRHSFQNQFCAKAEHIKCGVQRYAPNLCMLWRSYDIEPCETKVGIENITAGFRGFLLLGDDPIDILASQWFHGNFSITLKYPCQE